jgi:hypothetical protein
MQHLHPLITLPTTLLSLPTLLLAPHQVGNAARLAAEEVARLRGALVDLERKNKGALRGTSGSLDSQARIPWQPVGQGELGEGGCGAGGCLGGKGGEREASPSSQWELVKPRGGRRGCREHAAACEARPGLGRVSYLPSTHPPTFLPYPRLGCAPMPPFSFPTLPSHPPALPLGHPALQPPAFPRHQGV